MTLPIQQFQILSPDQANPLGYGIGQGIQDFLGMQQGRNQALQAQALKARLPYAAPEIQAQIQNMLAESQARQAIARQENFQVNNPAFMNPDAAALTGIGLPGTQNNARAIYGAPGAPGNPGMPNAQMAMPGGSSQSPADSIGTTMFNPQGGSTAFRAALAAGGQTPASYNATNGGTQQSPNQNNMQRPNYGYGITTPSFTTSYSDNPIANQWMIHKYGLNPVDQQNLQLSQNQKQMNIDNYNAAIQQAHVIADNAFNANQNIDEFVNSYNKLNYLQKGTIGGHNIPLTSEANQTEQSMSKLIGDSARIQQMGHVTNDNFALAAKQKMGRTFNPEAVSNISAGLKAYNNRAYEYEQFMTEANKQQVPYQTANLLWSRYNQLRPAFNSADNIVNSAYKNTWQDFLDPNAIEHPSKFTPANQGALASQNPSLQDIKNTANKHGVSFQAARDAMRQKGLV